MKSWPTRFAVISLTETTAKSNHQSAWILHADLGAEAREADLQAADLMAADLMAADLKAADLKAAVD